MKGTWSGRYIRCKLTGKFINAENNDLIRIEVDSFTPGKTVPTRAETINKLMAQVYPNLSSAIIAPVFQGFDLSFFAETMISAEAISLENSIILLEAISDAGGDIDLSRVVA